MAKTKDWGPQFEKLNELFATKSAGLAAHEANASAEVAAHDGSHAYGRHGYQSGWEPQLIRCVTSIAPDQTFDPRGLNPSIRRWNMVRTLDAHGAAITSLDLFGEPDFVPTAYATKSGKIAGGFLTPEIQNRARTIGLMTVNSLRTSLHSAAQFSFNREPRKKINVPMTSIHVVCGSARPGEPFGIGFAQRDPKSFRKQARELVVRCIDAFFMRQTWQQIYPKVDASVHKFNVVVLNKKKVAFPQIDDLFEYFDVDVLWQKSASMIFRRTYDPATKTHSNWRLVTMFPNSLESGWAPGLFLTDIMKEALRAQGMTRNKDDYTWTGITLNFEKTRTLSFPVPAWSADDPA